MGQSSRVLTLFICLIISISVAFAQYTDLDKYKSFNKIEKQLIKTRIAFDTPDSSVYAHVMEYDAKVNPNETKFYYWYKAGQIKKSRGGFDGRLLHGKYTAFLFNKNLKEKGNFTKGLKSGQWLTWHPNGELKVSANWSRGYLSGKYTTWNETGTLLSKGNYLKDKKQGKWAFYQPDGNFTIKKFKNDIDITNKKTTPIWNKIFKKKAIADTLKSSKKPTKPIKDLKPLLQKASKDTTKPTRQSKHIILPKPKQNPVSSDTTKKNKKPIIFKKQPPLEPTPK